MNCVIRYYCFILIVIKYFFYFVFGDVSYFYICKKLKKIMLLFKNFKLNLIMIFENYNLCIFNIVYLILYNLLDSI